jgi:hypothetical protein
LTKRDVYYNLLADMKKIAVLQNSSFGPYFFTRYLNMADIDPEKFSIHGMPEFCLKEIQDNRPQILITGTVNGSVEEGEYFILKARDINPKLRVIIFSSISGFKKMDGVVIVHKGAGNTADKLKKAIEDFEKELETE